MACGVCGGLPQPLRSVDGRGRGLQRLTGEERVAHSTGLGGNLLFRKKLMPNKLAKLMSLWEEGVYLGIRTVSGESIVGTPEGARRTRTVQRKPLSERWGLDAADLLGRVPWDSSVETRGNAQGHEGYSGNVASREAETLQDLQAAGQAGQHDDDDDESAAPAKTGMAQAVPGPGSEEEP